MQVPYIVGFQAQDAGLVIKVEIGDEIYLQTGYTVYRLACRISYPFLGKKNWFYAFMKIHITRVLDLDLTLQKSGSSWSGSDSKANLMFIRVLVTHMSSKAETESDPSKNHISFHISDFFSEAWSGSHKNIRIRKSASNFAIHILNDAVDAAGYPALCLSDGFLSKLNCNFHSRSVIGRKEWVISKANNR